MGLIYLEREEIIAQDSKKKGIGYRQKQSLGFGKGFYKQMEQRQSRKMEANWVTIFILMQFS